METPSHSKRQQIAELIFSRYQSQPSTLWLFNSKREINRAMLSDSIAEDQFLTVESHGRITGLAAIETKEFPSALNFSFSLLRKYFSFTSALVRYLVHILYKKIQIPMNLETFHISMLLENAEGSPGPTYRQLIDKCDEFARSLGKTTLVIELSGRQETLHRFLKTMGFKTTYYRKSHLPIIGKFIPKTGTRGFYRLEKDLLGDTIF